VTAQPPQPPRRRTFGSRPVTRAALVLLVAGVLLAALIQQWSGHASQPPPAPASPTASAPARS
jgi:hypothetical protein